MRRACLLAQTSSVALFQRQNPKDRVDESSASRSRALASRFSALRRERSFSFATRSLGTCRVSIFSHMRLPTITCMAAETVSSLLDGRYKPHARVIPRIHIAAPGRRASPSRDPTHEPTDYSTTDWRQSSTVRWDQNQNPAAHARRTRDSEPASACRPDRADKSQVNCDCVGMRTTSGRWGAHKLRRRLERRPKFAGRPGRSRMRFKLPVFESHAKVRTCPLSSQIK